MKSLSQIYSRFVGRVMSDATTPKFVRKPGVYMLASNGSQFEVSEAFQGRHTFNLTQIEGLIRERMTLRDYFQHEGWFAYVDSPTRIWLFDGICQLDLVTPKGRFSAGTKEIYKLCPAVVWAAAPESAKRYLHRLLTSSYSNN